MKIILNAIRYYSRKNSQSKIFCILKMIVLWVLASWLFLKPAFAQFCKSDQANLAGYIINRDINSFLKALDSIPATSEDERRVKRNFENRFKYKYDRSHKQRIGDKKLSQLYNIYREYWRKSLLDSKGNYDSLLELKLCAFFIKENIINEDEKQKVDSAKLDTIQKGYITKRGYLNTGYGKVLTLYDLFIWKNQIDTVYHIELLQDTIDATVCFLDSFLTLGWLEYATIGQSCPGGWVINGIDRLYCVKNNYPKLDAESFTVHFLQHEAQHLCDNRHFPNLLEEDLEYRAKMTELYYSDSSLYSTIDLYISEAKNDRQISHSFAAYCIIRDISNIIFNNIFECNIAKWKAVPKQSIKNAARDLLLKNNVELNVQGKETKGVIN